MRTWICALTLLFSLCLPAVARERPLKVATTFTVIADMAQNVAGEHAEVVSVTKAGAEIHDYEPTPKDLVRVRDAELLLWNGLGLERWFEKFFVHFPKGTMQVVVSAGITPIPIREHGDQPNPHAWMSPQNALIYIDNIAEALAAADPAHRADYLANAAAYKEDVLALDADLREALAAVEEEKRWLVSSEGAFSYLARDYGLKEAYLWPVNADRQGSPQQVAALIDLVREHSIPAVFSESTISDKAIRQVAKAGGAVYGGVLYVDSLSAENGAVPTYLDLLRVTTGTIAQGLQQQQ